MSSETKRPGAGARGVMRRARLAMAVGPDHLMVARLPRAPWDHEPVEVLQCSLAPPQRGGGWPELAEALRELAATLGVSGGTVEVALLRRLAHAKVIGLPPVRRGELAGLVRRNARRHFAVRDEPLVADARRLPGARSGPLVPTLAACAAASVVETVAAAAAEAGFRVGRIVPGPVALAEAVRARVPAARKGRIAVVASLPGAAELLLLDDGVPRRVEPLASADAEGLAARVAAALAQEADEGNPVAGVVVCGRDAAAVAVRSALLQAGGPPLVSAPRVEDLPAEAVLALGAATARASAPVLLPERVARERAKAARRRTVVFASASAVSLVLAAWLHLWGLQRELAAVQARRAAIRPAVAEAMKARASVDGVRTRLTAISTLETQSPDWTRGIAALARALPDSAHLRTLAADSGAFRLAGVARSASAVVPALEASPAFERVSLAAPVRWEQGDAGERFDVAAALARPRAGRAQ